MKLLKDIREASSYDDQLTILKKMGSYRASRPFTSQEIIEIRQFFRNIKIQEKNRRQRGGDPLVDNPRMSLLDWLKHVTGNSSLTNHTYIRSLNLKDRRLSKLHSELNQVTSLNILDVSNNQ